MFRTRIINHLVIASNKKFFTNRMMSSIFIIIFSNYLDINTGNLRKFNSTENKTALGRCYECFSRLREHNLRSMDITFIAVFILENTIFKTLKCNSLTHISLICIIINRNYFNTSRRNIEGNISTLNNKNLTIYTICNSIFNFLTFGIYYLTLILISFISFINASQQILVSTKSMTFNYLSHLARIQCE